MFRRFFAIFALVTGLAAIALVACSEAPEPTATGVVFNPTPAGEQPTVGPGGGSATPATGPTATPAQIAGDPEHGQQLFNSNGCSGCHSTGTNTIVGPGLQGVYAEAGTYTDLSADDYIRQSIKDPRAYIVPGFPPSLMPTSFGDTLSDQDIEDLLAYIKSLS